MDDFSILNVWGGGQLLAFSAFDGTTDWCCALWRAALPLK